MARYKLQLASSQRLPMFKGCTTCHKTLYAMCTMIPDTSKGLMRQEVTAYHRAYGAPLSVTFSSNEKHNAVMLRLSQKGQDDPIT